MERVITDPDGITWTCVQPFSGISEDAEKREAARVKGQENHYWVVCTPSGGAQSVRLALRENWEHNTSDRDLLQAIQDHQA